MPNRPPTVLVVDDEPSVRRLLRRAFESEGWSVLEAADAAGTHAALAAETVDIVTLDVAIGAESGLDLARELSARHDVGLIMISGRGDMLDTVVGLEVGADDYVSKPFELREVVARVRALHRRLVARTPAAPAMPPVRLDGTSSAEDPERFSVGTCTLWPERRRFATADAATIALTTGEYDLLEVFVRHPQQVLSRDQLMDRLKGHDWHPNDRSVDNQVARLRRKLQASGLDDAIVTVRGAGYLFVSEVRRLGSPCRTDEAATGR